MSFPARGAALIVVLWIMTLLALMAASLSLGVRREVEAGRALLLEAEVEAAARAAVAYAFYRLHLSDPKERWFPYGRRYRFAFGGFEMAITMTDESGKLNLNRLQEARPLLALLQGLGVEEEQASALADAILDWTDSDNLRRPFGAERRDYEAAGRFGPANAPFRSLEELQLVLGMTPELFQRLLPLVTVYGPGSGLNPWAAPEPLLRALPGVDPTALDLFLQERANWQPGAPLPKPPPLPGLTASQAQSGVLSFDLTLKGKGETRRLYLIARLEGDRIGYLERWSLPPSSEKK